jgi:hypothetical protein
MFSNKAPKKDSYLGYYFLQGAWREITIGNFSILQLVTLSKTVATSNFVENCCN